jgi:peptidoglycan/xylan/chitin deacetylase (PgdA/CDA1 family)
MPVSLYKAAPAHHRSSPSLPSHGFASVTIKSQIKTICGGLAAASGIYARKFEANMTVVTFHRVTDEIPEDGLTCSSRKFAQFCSFFRRHFTVLSLADQIQQYHAGKSLGGTLSITFDDGYLNNLEVAAPILKSHSLPATFFVTTGFIGSEVVPYWDKELPRAQPWMNWSQLRALNAMGFAIGNHTDTHLDLGRASPDDIRTELATSKRKLAEALGRPSRLFAYPFGGKEHITEPARNLVREAGFECCVSSFGGLNNVSPDPFNIMRVSIAGWFRTPDQFGFEYAMGKL